MATATAAPGAAASATGVVETGPLGTDTGVGAEAGAGAREASTGARGGGPLLGVANPRRWLMMWHPRAGSEGPAAPAWAGLLAVQGPELWGLC